MSVYMVGWMPVELYTLCWTALPARGRGCDCERYPLHWRRPEFVRRDSIPSNVESMPRRSIRIAIRAPCKCVRRALYIERIPPVFLPLDRDIGTLSRAFRPSLSA